MRKFIIPIFICILSVGCSAERNNPLVNSTLDAEQVTEETLQSPQLPKTIQLPQPTQLPKPIYPQLLASSLTDRIDFAINSEGQFCIYDGKKYGFMNESGKDITPYIYDYAYPFSEGLACCYRDGKYGFIDYNGNEAFPFIYDKANSFSEGLAYFEIGDKYGFIDKNGKEVFLLNCDSVSSFKEGLSYFSIDGKYGYIDKAGKEVIKAKYDDVGYFENGMAKVRLGDKIGVIGKDGNAIVPAEYDDVNFDNDFIITTSNEKYGCINKEGNLVLQPQCRYISVQNNFVCFTIDDRCGLADKNGKIILDSLYSGVDVISENAIIVNLDGKSGIVDSNGNVKVPMKYDYIFYDRYRGEHTQKVVEVKLNGKYGLLNLSDYSQVIPIVYDSIAFSYADKNRFAVKLNDKYGVIDKNGEVIIPFGYENIIGCDNGIFVLNKYGKFGLADSNGEILVPVIYDGITQIGDCYEIEIDNKYGILNKNGEVTIPPEYDYISIYYNYVYRSKNCYVATKYNSKTREVIIKTADYQDVDLSELLLKNEITPKIKLFNNYTKHGSLSTPFPVSERDIASKLDELNNCIKTFKLYDVDGSGIPILYIYAEPIEMSNFPLSYSGLFSIKDNQVNELLTGFECGGSMGGDFICLFKDKDNSKIVLGTSNHAGGFGGHAYGSDFYDYKNGEVNKIASRECISQTSKNYDESTLLKDASLFYGENNIPFTKDTILQAEAVTEYQVNNKQSTVDDYNQIVKRFKTIPLNLR